MKNFKIIVYFSFLTLLIACSKEDINVVIKGRVLIDCGGAPLANTNLIIWQDSEYSLIKTPHQGPYSAKTDGDGNFSFEVEKGLQIQIRVGSRSILRDIPVRSDLSNLGTFYANPTTSFVYRIKVNNPYQLGDTLHFNVQGLLSGANAYKALHTIAAPFTDTTFSLATNYYEQEFSQYQNIKSGTINMNYGIANSNKVFLFEKDLTFPTTYCPSKIDTLTIEIN